ncbi:HIT family protein [Aquiflexum sp.]|uniref:HIT family protein n=1 Tax=Aquiflexum sp. TaxID=1872584 RepID=UPI0035947D1F
MINFVKELLQKKYNPDGFNIGINIGPIAGQTIPQAHIHQIPRYWGVVDKPEGGVRGVVPEKKGYGTFKK